MARPLPFAEATTAGSPSRRQQMLPLGGVHGDLHSLCDSVFPSDVACRLSHDCGSVSANRRMRSWCHSIVIDRRPLDSFFADLGPGEELIRVDAERATDGWSLCVGVGGSDGALLEPLGTPPAGVGHADPSWGVRLESGGAGA